jgi:hypothetical protein
MGGEAVSEQASNNAVVPLLASAVASESASVIVLWRFDGEWSDYLFIGLLSLAAVLGVWAVVAHVESYFGSETDQ